MLCKIYSENIVLKKMNVNKPVYTPLPNENRTDRQNGKWNRINSKILSIPIPRHEKGEETETTRFTCHQIRTGSVPVATLAWEAAVAPQAMKDDVISSPW